MFNKCASLSYRGKVDEIYKKFTAYKFSVPTEALHPQPHDGQVRDGQGVQVRSS